MSQMTEIGDGRARCQGAVKKTAELEELHQQRVLENSTIKYCRDSPDLAESVK